MRAFISAVLLLSLIAPPSRASAVSTPSLRGIALDEAFAAALRRSEELAQRGEGVAELQARIDELWSNVKPRLNLVGSQQWQDTPGDAALGASSFAQTSRPQAAVSGHQPLFSGLREFLAVRAAKAQGESAELALSRARQLLYQDVTRSYLDLLGIQQEMRIRQAQVDIEEDRIRELRSRARIGRSRDSEVLAAQSQLAQTGAQLELAKGQERVHQWALRFLTGLEEDLSPREVAVPSEPEEVSGFLERARRRPDVEASRRDLAASELAIDIQRRQRWPTVNLDGNYYLKRPAGFQEHMRWDVTLSASLPLYAGGSIGARVREAEAHRRSAGQAFSLATRRAELEVRSAYSDLGSALAIVKALEKALTLAEANAKAQREDYRLGLVTNLDVLSSLGTEQETRLKLDQARLQAAWSRARLEVASGGPGSPK